MGDVTTLEKTSPPTQAPTMEPAAHFVPTTEQAKTPGVEAAGNELNEIAQQGAEYQVAAAGEHALEEADKTQNQINLPEVDETTATVHPSSTGLIDFAKAKRDKEMAKKNFNTEDLHPLDIPPKEDLSHKIGQLIDFVTFKKNKADQENALNTDPAVQQNQSLDTKTEEVPNAA